MSSPDATTRLAQAIEARDLGAAAQALDEGASTEACCAVGGRPALFAAVALGDVPLARLLLSRGASTAPRPDGTTLVGDAMRCGNVSKELLLALVDAGLELPTDVEAICQAAASTDPSALDLILEQDDADPLQVSSVVTPGGTALHMAALGARIPQMKRLLAAGLRADARDSNQQTPLMVLAARTYAFPCGMAGVDELLDQAVALLSDTLDLQDEAGQTALHLAFRESDRDAPVDDPMVKALQRAGARQDIPDSRGETVEDLESRCLV